MLAGFELIIKNFGGVESRRKGRIKNAPLRHTISVFSNLEYIIQIRPRLKFYFHTER